MKKVYLTTSILILCQICLAQPKTTAADTARWNYLKQELKSATGTREVDLLNELSWEYMWLIANEGIKTDTAALLNYINAAQKKAHALNYQKGLGHSYLIHSKIYKRRNKPFADSLRTLSKLIAEKIDDQQLLGRLAMDAGKTKEAYDYYKKAGDVDGEFEAATHLCLNYSSGNSDFNEQEFSYCQRAFELADVKKSRNISYFWRFSTFAYGAMINMYKRVGDHESAWNLFQNYGVKYAKLLGTDLYWDYAVNYSSLSKWDSSAFYYDKALKITPTNRAILRYASNSHIKAGNFKRAIEIVNIAYPLYEKAEANKEGGMFNWRGELHSYLAVAYDSLGQKSEANRHYQLALAYNSNTFNEVKFPAKKGEFWYGNDAVRKTVKMGLSESLSDIFNALGQYDSAYYYLKIYTQVKDSLEDKNRMWRLNMQLSNFKKALEDEKRSSYLKLLEKDNFIQSQRLKEQMLVQQQQMAQLQLFDKDSRLKDQQLLLRDQELLLKDQTLKEQQFLRQQKESALSLLDKDNRLKDQQLRQQTFLKNALLAGLFLILAMGVFFFSWLAVKRKNEKLQIEKRQAEFQQESVELEMQALRAQMNPHFIFNCLSSINRFIFKNDNEAASNYLTRFSRLIRMVLIHSRKKVISLEDELEMLRHYLDMERLRFKNGFNYSITTNNTIDAGAIFIPPLLLQPFCENAIWHGLMHKEGEGTLSISITEKKGVLYCTITDDGVGREKAALYKSKTAEKEKSLGLKITAERLALLNGENTNEDAYKIEDVLDENGNVSGTRVNLKICYKTTVEENTYAESNYN